MAETPAQTIAKHTTKTIDYAAVMAEWSVPAVEAEQLDRLRAAGLGRHPLLERGFFIGQYDLARFLDAVEAKARPVIVLSKSPDDVFSFNEFLLFDFARAVQAATSCEVVVFIRDDLKVLRRECPLEKVKEITRNCFKDLLAVGFDEQRTLITSDYAAWSTIYPTFTMLAKHIAFDAVQPAFGFDTSSNIGAISSPSVLAAPWFEQAYGGYLPDDAALLVLQSVVDVPFVKLVRSTAETLGYRMPSVLVHRNVPLLTGVAQLGAATRQTSILMSDTPVDVKKKVNSSFSGGRDTKEEEEKYGADVAVDVPFALLGLVSPDAELVRASGEQYGRGTMLSSQMKAQTVAAVSAVVAAFQQRKKPITNKTVEAYQKAHHL